MISKSLRYLFLIAFLTASVKSYGQGVTTSSIQGVVSTKGEGGLPGATVLLKHEPSGSASSTSTLASGRFNFPNLRVGGPYTLNITFVGYEAKKVDNIYLNLGEPTVLNIELISKSNQLAEIVVIGQQDDALNSKRTGASTTINNRLIKTLPTIKRSFEDFTRLSPQSSGFSFSGRNRLFNNLTIDGSIFVNPFGLDAALPGGQTKSQPISLDAIEQIYVSISPFDVRQSGFTGASVNVVTKSGTNNFTGSAYTFTRNEQLIGDKVFDTKIQNPNLTYNQSGLSFGGPIIKNKLFFFTSAELERRKDPGSTYKAFRPGLNSEDPNVANVNAGDLDAVSNYLQTKYNYQTGAYENYTHQTTNDKFSAKIDWNINKNHTFNIAYKYLKSLRDVLPNPAISVTGRGPNKNTLPFENNSYIINNNIHSIFAELNSRFGTRYSNKLQVGYTNFNDFRDSKSAPFPSVDILKDGRNYISFGLERFSINNKLDQGVTQVTDNFNFYLKDHTLTVGANFENFKFDNSFNLFYYPGHTYNSVAEFLVNTDNYAGEVSTANANPFRADKTNFSQLGFYIQDDWTVNDKLKLTLGLRSDIPLYVNKLPAQSNIESLTFYRDNQPLKVKVNQYPKQDPLISPRFGFNYDVKGDRTTILRGGTGIFTGRIPFVWLGNQSANNFIAPFYTFQVNSTANDFKFPQVWRTNLAWDQKLPGDITASVDFIYGRDLNAVTHRNYNMKAPTGNADGGNNGGDNRAIFLPGEERVNVVPVSNINDLPSFLDAGLIVLENTSKGYHYNITGQLSKTFLNNLFASLGYSYGVSKDITSNPGEIAANAFQTLPVAGDPNKPVLSYADHDLRHRFVGALSYRKEYKKYFASQVGLFFERYQGGPGEVIGEVGGRYSYSYAGDMNRDGISGNDLIYVPRTQSEIILVANPNDPTDTRSPAQLWSGLDAFINQDDYLSKRRGSFAERNGSLLKAVTKVDFRFAQDFFLNAGGKRNTLQFSVDVLNIGNLLNSEWGIRKTVNTRNPLSFAGYNTQGEPTFTFPLFGNAPLTKTYNNDISLNSRWQAQIGLRYSFN